MFHNERDHCHGEPPLDEILADPIVRLVMRADKVTRSDVFVAIRSASLDRRLVELQPRFPSPVMRSGIRREPRQIILSSPCSACSVRHVASYSSLTRDDHAHLASIASTRDVDRGQMLFNEGDPAKFLYTVVGGTFQMYKLLPDGRRQITGFLFSGDFLGLADDGVYAYGAEAVSDAALYRYRFKEMEALLARYPEMENRLGAVPDNAVRCYEGWYEEESIERCEAGPSDGTFCCGHDGALRCGAGWCEPQDGGLLLSSFA
jgi:CRP-like cAMP-binding protein